MAGHFRDRIVIGKWDKLCQSPKKMVIEMDMSVEVRTIL